MLYGIPMKRILKRVQHVRSSRYSKLREYFLGESDTIPTETDSYWRLHALTLPPGASAIGKTAQEVDLPVSQVEITLVRRDKERIKVSDDLVFQENDVLVLRGTSEGINLAENVLL